MFGGLLALFAVSALGTALALSATRALEAEFADVERLADLGRRLERVGAQLREYYIHQAHLALGMDLAEHLAMTRAARASLGEALEALAAPPGDAALAPAVGAVRHDVETLDALFEREFLPALQAGHAEHAAHLHHHAAGTVQAATHRLEESQRTLGEAIGAARARAALANRTATFRATALLGSALVLALGVAAWMVRAVRGPVERLRSAAQALAERPTGGRVPEEGPAEVVALGRALNNALAELERQRRARAEAETLASLGRVAAGVAHEINNPLAVMLGHARVLEAASAPDPDAARAIALEARHCQHIVQDLLDYARPALVAPLPVDLTELARAAAERASGGPLEVEVVAPAEALEVLADARRLDALIRNLVRNAEAFAQALRLELAREGDEVVLLATDDGPGLSSDLVDRVFEPFFTTRAEGTGLGLAIARAVATAHGGRLTARPGPGGRFELRLPSAAAPRAGAG